MFQLPLKCFLFFFNDTATTEIYTLSLHDALPICDLVSVVSASTISVGVALPFRYLTRTRRRFSRSEEHTSELQSLAYLVCRLLLEKKKNSKYLYTLSRYPLLVSIYLHISSLC